MEGATVEVALKTSEVQMLQLELEAGSVKFLSEWLHGQQPKEIFRGRAQTEVSTSCVHLA